jgi:hypothetical protein
MMGRPSTSIDEYFERSMSKISIWQCEADEPGISRREKVKIKNKIAALKSRMSSKTKQGSKTKNFAAV